MEYEFYEDVVDAYEAGIGVEPGDSLTDYIRKNNIKIKEIEPFRTDAKEGGLMVAIQRFNQGGLAKVPYERYTDESMIKSFANGGGIGTMMQPKSKTGKAINQLQSKAPEGEFLAYINPDEAAMLKRAGGSGEPVNGIPSFRPQDMGNKSNQKSSASRTSSSSKGPDKGTGGSKGNLGGGGGGQESNYIRYSPPTKKTYTAKTIDSKPVTGNDYRDSRNDFVNTLNRNNQITAERNNTRFIPYQGGARTSSYYNPNPLSNLFKLAAGIAIPGASFFLNKGSKLKDGIMNINDSIQNSDFGRSTSLMDYLDMKKFGGYDEREMARQINKDEAKNLQARIDGGEFGGLESMKPPATIKGPDIPNNFGSATVPFNANTFDDTVGNRATSSFNANTFDDVVGNRDPLTFNANTFDDVVGNRDPGMSIQNYMEGDAGMYSGLPNQKAVNEAAMDVFRDSLGIDNSNTFDDTVGHRATSSFD